jgi:hypothetical protein
MRKTPCCVAQQFLVSCVFEFFESQVELCQHDPLLLSVLFSLPGFDAEVAKMDAWRATDNSMNVLKGIFSKSARNNGRIHFIQKVKDVSPFYAYYVALNVCLRPSRLATMDILAQLCATLLLALNHIVYAGKILTYWFLTSPLHKSRGIKSLCYSLSFSLFPSLSELPILKVSALYYKSH